MGPKARTGLAQKLDSLVKRGEKAVSEARKQLTCESEAYIGLRYHGKRTQLDQDRVLTVYRQFIKSIFGEADLLGDDPTDDDLDKACFPFKHTSFYERARQFMIFVIANASPRSSEDTHITYSTATKYRHHLLFWMQRKYRERDEDAPRLARVYTETTEAMRGAALSRNLGKSTTSKAYIGLAEIQFMIDLDMRSTPAIEVAEQHHVAWCIARCTALRPSSFGPQSDSRRETPGPNGYADFIMWNDLRFSRGAQRGIFHVRLNIRNLKTSRIDPKAGMKLPYRSQVSFDILSPQTIANIPFSVPHRLLVMALRRGALDGIETLEELLEGQNAVLHIKDEFLNQPVFLASVGRGLALNELPLPATALTNYIQIRGVNAGFRDKITFYSIRRRLASDLAAQFGNDAAREIMTHDPASRVLEMHYLEFNYMRHTTAVGLGEDVGGQERELRANLHEQLLNRLDQSRIEKSRGQALNRLVQETLSADEEFSKLEHPTEVKNYIARVRRWCFNQLWKQLHVEAQRTLTVESLEKRKDELLCDASTFAQRVISAAKKRTSTDNSESDLTYDQDAEVRGVDFDLDFPEEEMATKPEQDFEDRDLQGRNEFTVDLDEDVLGDATDESQAADYFETVRTFMDILLTNSLSTYNPNETLKCPLCADDDTLSQELKDKLRTVSHHKDHLSASMHTGFEHFRRVVEAAKTQREEENPDEDARYECPYCVELAKNNGQEKVQSFHRFDYLARHIEQSDSETIHGTGAWKLDEDAIAKHNDLKTAAGWYEEEFRAAAVAKRRLAGERKTMAKAAGVKWSKEAGLSTGIPVEGRSQLVQGGPSLTTDELTTAYTGSLESEDLDDSYPSSEELKSKFAGYFTDVDPRMSTDDILEQHAGLLTDRKV